MLRSTWSLVLFGMACSPPSEPPPVHIEPEAPTTLDTLRAVFDGGQELPVVATWKRDGAVVPGLNTLEVSADQTSRDQRWTVELALDAGDPDAPTTSASVTIGNAPPTGTVTLGPEGATANGTLLVEGAGSDPDGDPVTFRWSWSIDGTELPGESAETLQPATGRRGSVVRATGIPSDGRVDGEPATDELTLGNTTPIVRSVSILPDPATRAADVRAEVDAIDPDGDEITLVYAWKINGEEAGTSPIIPAERLYRGAVITLDVTASDATTTSEPKAAGAVYVRNAPPTIASATLSPGNATEATVLTCTPSGVVDADGDDVVELYRWTVNGQALPDARSSTLTGADFSRGDAVSCEVSGDDDDQVGPSVISNTVTIGNSPPTVTGVIRTASPLPGQSLQLDLVVTDLDGDEVELDYVWLVEGAEAGYASNLPPNTFSNDLDVACRITPSDPSGAGPSFTTPTVRIRNAIPQITGVVYTPETPTALTDLRVSASATDPENDPVSLIITWEVNDVAVPGVISDTLTKNYLSRGDSVRAVIVVSDATGTATPYKAMPVVVANAPPMVSAASISPSPPTRAGPATCTATGWIDADGDPQDVVYSWFLNAAPLANATPSLSASLFKRGDTLRCAVIPDDGFDLGSSVSSSTVTVGNAPPRLTSVTLSPATPTEASTIIASVSGLTDPDTQDTNNLSVSYVWYVNDAIVTGAAAAQLPAVAFNRGDSVRVLATPRDPTTSGTAVASAPVVVANSPPSIQSLTISPASPNTSTTVTAVLGATDPDPVDAASLTTTYRWRVDNFTVQESSLNTLSGSFFARGQQIEVSAVVSDGAAASPRFTATKVTVVNAPPTSPGVRVNPRWSRTNADDLYCELLTPPTDPDSDLPFTTFSWLRDGVAYPQAGDVGPQRTVYTNDTVPAEDLGEGEVWTCQATASDGTTTSVPGTSLARTGGFELSSLRSGTRYGCGVDENGVVRCWGLNDVGQALPPDGLLARRVDTGSSIACAIRDTGQLACWGSITTAPAGSTYVEIGVGLQHACARNQIGSLTCWGAATNGSTTPPPGAFKRLAVGGNHACALASNGTATCWGSNSELQSTPPAGVTFLDLAAGGEFTCGLTTDHTLRCWGDERIGTPPSGTFEDVQAGAVHACAIDADDQLTCWGDSGFVSLDVPAGDYAEVAPGSTHTCANRTDGSTTCWGTSSYGEQIPPTIAYNVLVPGNRTICGIRSSNGQVNCWGDNTYGVASPPLLPNAVALAVGPTHACALLSGGLLFCWGDDTYGKATSPGGQGWKSVDVGAEHTCGVNDVGAIDCWGDDTFGEVTGPFTGGPYASVAVGTDHTCGLTPGGAISCWGTSSLNRLAAPTSGIHAAISGGDLNTCAITPSTTLTCWGDNQANRSTPTVLPGWTALSMGSSHGCARSAAGALTCWGDTIYKATTVPSSEPYTSVFAGERMTCGRRFDGRSQCWGLMAH